MTFCLFGLLCYSVYNAGLTAILTVENRELPIENLDQIAEGSDYQILVLEGMAKSSLVMLHT